MKENSIYAVFYDLGKNNVGVTDIKPESWVIYDLRVGNNERIGSR